MTTREHDRRIDYIEFSVSDVAAAKRFYSTAFGWKFTDYGPDYAAFEDGRLTGGFHGGGAARPGGPLVVIYAVDLEAVQRSVEAAGGRITTPDIRLSRWTPVSLPRSQRSRAGGLVGSTRVTGLRIAAALSAALGSTRASVFSVPEPRGHALPLAR